MPPSVQGDFNLINALASLVIATLFVANAAKCVHTFCVHLDLD